MGGSRRRPSRLKLVEGTDRADRATGAEPTPPAGEIVRPAYLTYRAAEVWDEYAPAFIAMGTLTVVDVPSMAAWCVLSAKFEEAKADMSASLIAQMRLLGAEFGVGAGARAKLGTGGKKAEDPADKFFRAG